ncbi:CRAL/TRIO domain-containing protein [Xylaria cf. heliscus]|nr:CRAL/TRIO domain-containing protein [Xylaria cf. heliscus]
MTVDLLPSDTTGDLTPDEEQKLKQAWIHLLRLCGVENLEGAGSPQPAPDITRELRKHVGDMSPGDFRQGLWGFILTEHPDALVVRFLRARNWDAEKAMAMLVSAVHWRVERNMAEVVIRDGESVAMKEEMSADDKGLVAQYRSGKSYVRGTDRENRIIYVIRVRLHDPQLQSGDAMETYVLHNIESLRILAKPPPNDKFCLIFDMTGFGLKNMDFHVVKFLISVFEARYPETLGVVLIHNAPFVFWGIWNMIKGWLDPVIASKINFTRKSADLLHFISEENLQTSFGGKDTWEYEYIEPAKGENAKLEEAEKRTEIQRERNELIGEFELETIEWACLAADSPAGKEKASRRAEVAHQLDGNYWKLDPYIRSRTYYHRLGLVGDN